MYGSSHVPDDAKRRGLLRVAATRAGGAPSPSWTPLETLPAAAPVTCLNCEARLSAKFCGACGQKDEPPARGLKDLALDFVQHPLIDTKLWRTLALLLCRPGALTEDYLRGRRTRYVRPLKLYVTISVMFFATMALLPRPPEFIHYTPDAVPTTASGASHRQHLPIRWVDQRLQKTLNALDGPAQAETLRSVQSNMAQGIPKMIFFLLPLSAVFLKLLWRRRFFVEHLVFSLHMHSFGFAAGLVLLFRTTATSVAYLLGATVYTALAFKRVYRDGWVWTLVKLAVLGNVYLFTIAVALGVTAIVSFLAG